MDLSFIVESFQLYPGFYLFTVALYGLMLGSFANVVIHRLPIMIERDFVKNCREHMDLPEEQPDTFNLAVPNSRCPQCHTPIRYWQNIPIISYLILRGRCANCRTKISLRYPLIEGICGLLALWAGYHFGVSWQAFGAIMFSWTLLVLTFIDLDKMWLPDVLTLPLMWAGLLVSLDDWYTPVDTALLGACFGYLFLWSIYHLFRWITGKEGMGHGDFKLLAALGAWLGLNLLPVIILLSSLVATLIGVTMMILYKRGREHRIPFGPYLAMGGLISLYWGQDITRWMGT